MIISNVLPSNYANAVAPYSPLGSSSVGEESVESKNSSLKPVEGLADSAKQEFQRGRDSAVTVQLSGSPEDTPANADGDTADVSSGEPGRQASDVDQAELERDQAEIQQLAARDREVRAHEQAHAAVGGTYAGAPVFRFERGPDGISYAVSGEVSISTSKVSGDPQATIEKAQQIRRAALAPADPSPQDRQVAAYAAQLELEARQELRSSQQQEQASEEPESDNGAVTDETAALQSSTTNDRSTSTAGASSDQELGTRSTDQQRINSLDLNRKLVDIGVTLSSLPPTGSLLDQLA